LFGQPSRSMKRRLALAGPRWFENAPEGIE
jgi:hypothetical protein